MQSGARPWAASLLRRNLKSKHSSSREYESSDYEGKSKKSTSGNKSRKGPLKGVGKNHRPKSTDLNNTEKGSHGENAVVGEDDSTEPAPTTPSTTFAPFTIAPANPPSTNATPTTPASPSLTPASPASLRPASLRPASATPAATSSASANPTPTTTESTTATPTNLASANLASYNPASNNPATSNPASVNPTSAHPTHATPVSYPTHTFPASTTLTPTDDATGNAAQGDDDFTVGDDAVPGQTPSWPSNTASYAPSVPNESPTAISDSPSAVSDSPSTPSTSPSVASHVPSTSSLSPSAASESPSAGSQSPSAASEYPSAASESSSAFSESPSASAASHVPSLSSLSPSVASPPPSTASESPSASASSLVPSMSSQSPSAASESPSAASESPSASASSHVPSLSSQSPSVASLSPSVASESPSGASESPSVASHAPSVSSQSPSATGTGNAGLGDDGVTGTDDAGVDTDDTGFDDDQSDGSIQCKNSSFADAITIPVLFQYTIVTDASVTVAKAVEEIELGLLSAVAKGMLTCSRRLDAAPPLPVSLRRRLDGAIRISADPADDPASTCGEGCTVVNGGMTVDADEGVESQDLRCQLIKIVRNTMSELPDSIDGLEKITFIQSEVDCDEERAVEGAVTETQSDDNPIPVGAFVGLGLGGLMFILLALLLVRRNDSRRDFKKLRAVKGENDSIAPLSVADETNAGDNTELMDVTGASSEDNSMVIDIENSKIDVHRCKSSTCQLCARAETNSVRMYPVSPHANAWSRWDDVLEAIRQSEKSRSHQKLPVIAESESVVIQESPSHGSV